jgi:nucleotide-binding universal stress UspA family protein
MLKDILVNLPLEISTRDHVSEFAVSFASQFGAHVTAMAHDIEPALQPSILGVFPNHIMMTARTEVKRLAEAAKDRFEQAAKRSDVSAQCLVSSAPLAVAAKSFGTSARRFDLAMVGQPKEEILSPENMFIETALFDSGRPLVVIPYIHQGSAKIERIAVCWDGGRAAARALADALPLLQKAKVVDVLVVTSENPKSNEVTGADIAHHLARHQLPVTLRELADNSLDVGNTILNFAADNATDLLVMGGYGHWRLREFILGGATRTILNSMTVPTFLSH